MITFREARIDDFESVKLIENECFKQPYSDKDLRYEFEENPVNKIIVAEDGNKVIGFIDYLITFNSSTIMQIAVTNFYRNKGIGSSLLKEMEKSFPTNIDDLVETITLEVRESNVSARKLSARTFSEKVVVKSHYYNDGENAIYMLKRL